MSLSLYGAILPKTNPLGKEITVKSGIQPDKFMLKLKAYKLILTIGSETALAISNSDYKKFDALVKNFGCQITALEVVQLIKANKQKLLEESITIYPKLNKAITIINEAKQDDFKKALSQVNCLEKLAICISNEFAKLLRFRMLCIVNDNKPGREALEETPFTNLEKIKLYDVQDIGIGKIIDSLQLEESRAAISFIQGVKLNNCQDERKEMISLMLQAVSKDKTIPSVPLLYNTEAVLRGYEGILLIKNKLTFCGKRIDGSSKIKLFLEIPSSRIVSEEEVKLLDKKMAIMVIEGYIQSKNSLIKAINEIGILTIINANCATIKQYAGNKSEEIQNLQAKEEIQTLVELEAKYKIKNEILNLDHFYAASLNEELGDLS